MSKAGSYANIFTCLTFIFSIAVTRLSQVADEAAIYA